MDPDVFALGATALTIALIKKLVDLVRFAAGALRGEAGAGASLITQAATYFVSIFAVWLVASSAFADGWVLGPITMADASFATLVLVGLLFGSSASVVVDYLKARDNTQSAAIPPLVETVQTTARR